MPVATEEAARSARLFIRIEPQGPVPVYDKKGEKLGSAVVTFADGGLAAEVFLDRNRPETFDLEVNPERVKATVGFHLFDDGTTLCDGTRPGPVACITLDT